MTGFCRHTCRHTCSKNSPKIGREIACDGPDFNDLAGWRHSRHTFGQNSKKCDGKKTHVFNYLQKSVTASNVPSQVPSHCRHIVTICKQAYDNAAEKTVTLFCGICDAHISAVTPPRFLERG